VKEDDFSHLFQDGNPFKGIQLNEDPEGGYVETVSLCVQCGYCCTVSSCGHGRWNPEKHQCDFLGADSKCTIYDSIRERESKQAPAWRMMGCGCSSPLCNEMRDRKIAELNAKK
jgi:hypothetical protein